MRWLLDALYLCVLTLLSPWLIYRAIRTGRYRRGLGAKLFGLAHPLPVPNRPVWFHGVSVGEIHLLRQVIASFRRLHPDQPCVVSTTTDAGYDEARRCFADLPIVHFPFDFSWAVKRTLRQVDAALVVLAEGELWPNFLMAAQRRGRPDRRHQRSHESTQRRPLSTAALAHRPAVRLHRTLRRTDGRVRRRGAFAGRIGGPRPRHGIGEVRRLYQRPPQPAHRRTCDIC